MYKRRAVYVLAAVVVFAAAGLALAGEGYPNRTVLPPGAYAYGKSLTQWLDAYWRWFLTMGGPVPYQPGPGPVAFMPIPVGEQMGGSWTPEDPAYLLGEIELTLKPGTPFVLPQFVWYAEIYDPALGIPPDPVIPNELIQSIVTDAEVTLDGKPIVPNLWDYYVGPKEFDPILMYPAPSSYGSIGAWAFQGSGFVWLPLTPGTHTITLYEKYIVWPGQVPGINPFGVIYDNTWIIHVGE